MGRVAELEVIDRTVNQSIPPGAKPGDRTLKTWLGRPAVAGYIQFRHIKWCAGAILAYLVNKFPGPRCCAFRGGGGAIREWIEPGM